MTSKASSAPRAAAIVGPYLVGKTSLLESILDITGAIGRKGSVKEGNTVGDASPEARQRQMSTELNVATTQYLDETWTFLDCPGSIELFQEPLNALMVADTAVVMCEPDAAKVLTLGPIFRVLAELDIPHIVFINKVDHLVTDVQDVVEGLKSVSRKPLVLREIPIREGEEVTGYVDLASKRAFKWSEGGASEPTEIPDGMAAEMEAARTDLLETLADFDDALLEQLLEDTVPDIEGVYGHLMRDLQAGHIVPVFFGSAERGRGIRRLLKALRHEAPEPSTTAARLGIDPTGGEPLARVFKTMHAGHMGKLSFARVWRGEIADGMSMDGHRISGLFRMLGHKQEKMAKAAAGDVVALGRLEEVRTGALLSPAGVSEDGWPEALKPMFSIAIHAEQRADEVKLSGALAKLRDEDPSLKAESYPDTGQLLLWGQGEMHLLIAIDRLANRYNVQVASERRQVPYKETIRKTVSQHARHKKQTGGHGEFGDVHLDIKPLPRGSGFSFGQTVSGGVVPKQYIPAVENGVKEYLARGPLGFPVVDIAVTLTDGQYHSVDSSEMAFKKAAQLAMREGMPNAGPVLLEPILQVTVAVPNEFTSKVQRLVSGRRGQIMGFGPREGWPGWDEVSVQMPQSETHDLVIELRSMTLGVGRFEWRFVHLQELSGKEADQVIHQRAEAG